MLLPVVLHFTPLLHVEYWHAIINHTLGQRYAAAVLFSVKKKGGVEKRLCCGGIARSLCKKGYMLKRTPTDQAAVFDTLGVRTGCGCTT